MESSLSWNWIWRGRGGGWEARKREGEKQVRFFIFSFVVCCLSLSLSSRSVKNENAPPRRRLFFFLCAPAGQRQQQGTMPRPSTSAPAAAWGPHARPRWTALGGRRSSANGEQSASPSFADVVASDLDLFLFSTFPFFPSALLCPPPRSAFAPPCPCGQSPRREPVRQPSPDPRPRERR